MMVYTFDLWSTIMGCKDIEFRKSEFEHNTHLLKTVIFHFNVVPFLAFYLEVLE